MKPVGIVIHSIATFFSDAEVSSVLKRSFKTKLGFITCEAFLKLLGYGYHCVIFHTAVNYLKPPTDEMSSKKEAYRLAHAGVSEWNGYKNLNNHFLGVCFAVTREEFSWSSYLKAIKKPFSEEQFSLGLNTVRGYMSFYNIKKENIARHSDVSPDSLRGKGKGKVDVGSGFQWERFKSSL